MAENEERPGEKRQGFLDRLSEIETVLVAIIAFIALAGIMWVGKGYYIKAKTEVSHGQLSRPEALQQDKLLLIAV
ncbi:hypothetical protein J2Z31_003280 [Sinorhizobium kostiense]|uniref:Uncharacterized protein n=1 Tax=Sinorhizobium kostiense TaxID=76747 RepID=A0ABS4R1H3_9HYPH|nr:hypothetical protein [Sinorhizobium kostiense]MBP2236766.1 hypothetical protein [Sinorhizobium kostiense]